MPTGFPEVFRELSRPFDQSEVKQRPAPGGRSLSYVTKRTVENRLDEVLGPENWKTEYFETQRGIKCRLSIRLDDNEWISKEDGGGFADMKEPDDSEKSGYTSAFKRAASCFGPGRYLYNDGYFGDGHGAAPAGQNNSPPPQRQQESSQPSRQGNAPQGGSSIFGNLPRTGRQLFPWLKSLSDKTDLDCVGFSNTWGKRQGHPWKSSEWDDAVVADAVQAIIQKVCEVKGIDPPSGGSAPAQPERGGASVKSLQDTLAKAVWELVPADAGDRNAAFYEVFDQLGGIAVANTDGQIIEGEIASCQDKKVLQAYLEAVKTYKDDIPF